MRSIMMGFHSLFKFYHFSKLLRSYALPTILNLRYYSSVKYEFVEKTVKIQTCGALYRKWKDEKVFSRVPESGLVFNVPYIDTLPQSSDEYGVKKFKTIVALHGAPGSWRDFSNLSSFLHHLGHRVIVPSFPDFSVYPPGVFRHSHLERAEYVKDFLEAISVSQVDLLVCHSASSYTGLNLCLNKDNPKVKSVALVNPGAFNIKGMSATKAFNFLKAFVKAGENPVLLKFLKVCGPFILRDIVKTRIKFESILDPLLSATSMMNAEIPQSKDKFQQLVLQKLPVLFIFSENDPLIRSKPSYELAELFGAQSSDIFKYNKEGILEQKGKSTQLLKVLAFQEGSHYVFLKYPEIVNKEIADFLDLQGKFS